MKRSLLAVILAVMVAVSLLSGCGKQEAAGTPETAGSPAESTAQAPKAEEVKSGPKTITFWEESSHKDEAAKTAEMFMAKYPDIKVNVEIQLYQELDQKALVALKAASGPDVIVQAFASGHSFVKQGLIAPLDDYMAQSGVKKEDFFAKSMELATVDGKLHGLPYRNEGMALMYNKGLFKAAGLDPERPPETWEEVVEYAKKLTIDKDGDGKADQYGYGLVGNNKGNVWFRLMPEVWNSGVDVMNEDMTKCLLNTPEAKSAAKHYTDLLLKHKVAPEGTLENSAIELRSLFLNETIAMYITGPFDIPIIRTEAPNLEIGIGLYPGKIKGQSHAALGGWVVEIPKNAKDPDTAWKFIEYFTSDEIQQFYSQSFPGRLSAWNAPKYQNELSKQYLKQLEHTRNFQPLNFTPQAQDIVFKEIQAVLSGLKDSDTAMDDAAQQIDALVK